MLVAGTCNAIAFFACTKALQLVSVVRVNAINSAQAALCSLAGVLMFGEPQTWTLTVGVLLTMLGIGLMEYRPRSAVIEHTADV
jgi:drug/metabolite transporter (DMT)-like permease